MPQAPPPMARARTFHVGVEEPLQPRSRRGSHQAYSGDDSEDDAADRSRRRTRRTASPEPIPPQFTTRYAIGSDNRTSGRREYYPADEASPMGRTAAAKSSSHKHSGSYPKVDPSYAREASHGYGGGPFKVKTSKAFTYDDVQFSKVQHNTVPPPEEGYAY
jgi:hypothetical protein